MGSFRPCAGGFSVVNAIFTELQSLIASVLAQRRMTILLETVAKSGNGEWGLTSKESERPDTGRDSLT